MNFLRGTKTSPSCGRVVGIRSVVAIPVDDDNHVLNYQCVCAGRSLILAAAVADWLSIQKSRRLIRCQNNTRLRLRLQSTTVLPAHRSLRFSVSTTLSSTQSSQWSTKSSSGAASVRTPLPKPSQHIKSNTNHHQSLQASQSASGNSASKCVPSSTKNPFGRGPSSPPREEVSDIG